MTEADRKFMESAQEAVRLKIALQRFFEVEEETWRRRYGDYLKMRIRPAMEHLIREGEAEKIGKLLELDWITERNLEEFLKMAGKTGNGEVLALLLHAKREKYGFKEREYSL